MTLSRVATVALLASLLARNAGWLEKDASTNQTCVKEFKACKDPQPEDCQEEFILCVASHQSIYFEPEQTQGFKGE